jgi:G6PDH family F420-dependent oxidoreductase
MEACMIELGYALSSEEHRPNDLVRNARRAEEAGFSFSMISDHFHPWIDRQGQSPFVWSVIGGIAHATERLQLGTGVTCPTIRIHPAIIAQAAATSAAMMPGRFFLGVGSGENLNEHILGDGWPNAEIRLEMLEEAIEVMRKLWQGESVNHRGCYFTVDNARIYTLPDELPAIAVAASGKEAAELAGRVGDALVSTAPKRELVEQFQRAGGSGKPCYGQITVCWANDDAAARRTAHEWWPNTVLPGILFTELPLPAHFEQAAKIIREEDVAKDIICGPDPERYVEAVREYQKAGFDHIYFHQIGPDQEGFIRFFERELAKRDFGGKAPQHALARREATVPQRRKETRRGKERKDTRRRRAG